MLFVKHPTEDLSSISLRYSLARITSKTFPVSFCHTLCQESPPKTYPVSYFDTFCQASARRSFLYLSSIFFCKTSTREPGVPPKTFPVFLFDSICQESHQRPSLYLSSRRFVRHPTEDLRCILIRFSFYGILIIKNRTTWLGTHSARVGSIVSHWLQ
jgi:hypothetical protein